MIRNFELLNVDRILKIIKTDFLKRLRSFFSGFIFMQNYINLLKEKAIETVICYKQTLFRKFRSQKRRKFSGCRFD